MLNATPIRMPVIAIVIHPPDANFSKIVMSRMLGRAAVLPDGRGVSTGTDAAVASQAQDPTRGKVGGPLEWPGVNSRERLIKVRVTLTGEDAATKSVNVSRPFRLGERYEFGDLAPGKYRLVAKAEDGAPAMELWDQAVTVVVDGGAPTGTG